MDIPAQAKTAPKGLQKKKKKRPEEDLCWIVPYVRPPDDPVGQGTELNWTDI